MIWDPNIRTRVFVVDSSSDGYETLSDEKELGSAEVSFFSNGRDALRAASDDAPAMWIVNLRLPDMDGTDLQAILRHNGSRAAIALVGDEYTVEDEIEARCAGADLYFAKPLHRDLIFS